VNVRCWSLSGYRFSFLTKSQARINTNNRNRIGALINMIVKPDRDSREQFRQLAQKAAQEFAESESKKAWYLHVLPKKVKQRIQLNCMFEFAVGFREVEGGRLQPIFSYICPHCRQLMQFVDGHFGPSSAAWVCKADTCDTSVSCFKGTMLPRGFPALRGLRWRRAKTKEKLNQVVDELGYGSLPYVYDWLAEKLGFDTNYEFITLASISPAELYEAHRLLCEWLNRRHDPSSVDQIMNR